ncbi:MULTISPECIES: hypothetical protein [Streptomyces]|uniref:hypothetical protein n=1 Tax=Streptomyces TaxID=1883 RepID=UPI000B1F52AE|nr:hypothetical protein [Streptomyces sp. NRRL S-475]
MSRAVADITGSLLLPPIKHRSLNPHVRYGFTATATATATATGDLHPAERADAL